MEAVDLESVQIINELGQQVSFEAKEEEGKIEISINDGSGVYFLVINNQGVYQLVKL